MASIFGAVFMLVAVLMFIYPEKFARWRLSGAKNPEPTAGLVRFTRYVISVLLFLISSHMFFNY